MNPKERENAFWRQVDALIDLALEEDLPGGDITSAAVVGAEDLAEGVVTAREELTVSGLEIAAGVFRRLDESLRWEPGILDGERADRGSILATVTGRAGAILAGERTALNFLQHLCGIATVTARVVDSVRGRPVTILDTRKTLPGWRHLEKKAVRDGGGTSHRMSLSESVLIKDNHIALAGSPADAVKRARGNLPGGTTIEVEVENVQDLLPVIDAGADIILFDNADVPTIAEAVRTIRGRGVLLEASGGIGPAEAADVAATGVDRISMGCLTHSAPSVDISMDVRRTGS